MRVIFHINHLLIFFLIASCSQKSEKAEIISIESEILIIDNKQEEKYEIILNEVTIGDQIWKTSNSTFDTFANGDPIPIIINANDWFLAGENQQPAMCFYNNDPSTAEEFGVIYNFYAISDIRGIARDGWKIPTDKDIKQLNQFIDKGLRSEMAVILNKEQQGIDVEEFWRELNENYQDYCPVNLHPNLIYLTQKKYISRDWKGKFEIYSSDKYSTYNIGFWTSTTSEEDRFNLIHNLGNYFNVQDCWKFNYSVFYKEIQGRQSTAEIQTASFNHNGYAVRFLKTID